MKVQFKKNIIGIISFIIQLNLYAQTDPKPQDYLPNIVPPSPEASSLGSYGNQPIGLFTGSTNVNINLIDFKTKELSFPFSLSYVTNGIKVDDVNSKVGLGWNLIGGGVINRVIRDQPDEDGEITIPSVSGSNYLDPTLMQALDVISENEYMDSERDLFSYNFNGKSGQFVYDSKGSIVTMPQSDIKIEVYMNQLNTDFYNFKITDVDGTIYFFEEKEQTMLRTSGEGHALPSLNYSAWYLTKVKTIKGSEILIKYEGAGSYYIASQSQQLSMSYPSYQYSEGKAYSKGVTISPIYSHHTRIIGKKIKSIESDNPKDGKLEFIYEDLIPNAEPEPDIVLKEVLQKDENQIVVNKITLNYLLTSSGRIFLNELIMFDQSQKYKFEYIQPNSFPNRLHLGRDDWGYFNGINSNTNLIPKINDYGLENVTYNSANKQVNHSFSKIGMLSKITYPTKGYSVFEYESNDFYSKEKDVPPSLFSFAMNIDTFEGEFNKTVSQNIYTYFDQRVRLYGSSQFWNCDSGSDLGESRHKTETSVFCVEDNEYVRLFEYNQFGQALDLGLSCSLKNVPYYFLAKKGKTYRITIKNARPCTRGYTSVQYFKDDYVVTSRYTNQITGGNRVKSIIDYNYDNVKLNSKRYYYAKLNTLNISSGFKGFDPRYINIRRWRESYISESSGAGLKFREFSDLIVNSSSLSDLSVNGNNIYYPYVTISYGGDNFENGAEEKQFVVNKDYFGKTIYNSDDISGAPFTNFGWNNGFEIESKSYSKKGTNFYLQKSVVNEYFLDESKTIELSNFATRKKYDEILEGSATYYCKQTDLNTKHEVGYCIANHDHIYYTFSGKCIAFGADNRPTYIYHACYGKNVGDQITYYNKLDNVDIVEYKNLSFRYNLNKNIVTNYFYDSSNTLQGTLATTTNYIYDNPNHLQLTSQTTKTSASNVLVEKKYQYAHEMAHQPMIEANMISIPLKTETFRNGSLIGMQETVYQKNTVTNNLILPTQVFSKKDNQQTSELKATYNSYDDKGNVTQYTIESGMPVTIIWGYNKTQPIAKIENARYTDVQQYEASLQTLSNGTDENALLLALNTLRSNFPNAMVTTYTHKPLIGVSTVTSPVGEKVTYTYDEFNRLKQVIDHNGNILNENQYNYRAQ